MDRKTAKAYDTWKQAEWMADSFRYEMSEARKFGAVDADLMARFKRALEAEEVARRAFNKACGG